MQFINHELEVDKRWVKLKEKLQNNGNSSFEEILELMKAIEDEEKTLISEIEMTVDEENFPMYKCIINEKGFEYLSRFGLTYDEVLNYYKKLCENFEFRKVILN